MALKCTFKTSFGFELPEAYVKISEFNGTKDNIIYRVFVYANKNARDSDLPPVYSGTYDTTLQDGVLLQNLYNHLKTFEMFSSAEDC